MADIAIVVGTVVITVFMVAIVLSGIGHIFGFVEDHFGAVGCVILLIVIATIFALIGRL
ncbi:hypothetical protein CPT_Mater95 [Bacillus phage Mater]|uniref:Uncharacterized protein n=1 Tax=Bacillus phage Mater TaxID=1540090 RepID=A0A0A0RMQ4_9CAUD|nr:hypothetical protein CPT_Mater95 [Bacillus phage Mater]AIW03252.1 hypothetical protein CPT_Mater95 [Bacillus phage Mater]